MAAHRPVVLAGGRFKQLPAGSRLDVPADWDALKAPVIAAGVLTIDLVTPAGFRVALNQNVTTLSFANVPTGRVVVFTITWVQDATGGRTVAFPASVKADGGGAPVQPAAGANAVTVQSFYTDDGGATIWQARPLGIGSALQALRVAADGVSLEWSTESIPVGVGQSWQDFTSSRAYDTTYTNTTGRPIMVQALGGPANTNNAAVLVIVNDVAIYSSYGTSGIYVASALVLVPNLARYRIESNIAGAAPLYRWRELR